MINTGILRWSLLTVCVVEESRIRTKDTAGVVVVTVTVLPRDPVLGAEEMTGRVAALPSAFSK